MLRGVRGGLLNELLPDAAARGVDDAQEARVVVVVGHELQVGEHVAHLLALEEAHASRDDVGDVLPAKHLLQGPREVIGPEEHAEVLEPQGFADHEGPDPRDDVLGLVDLRFRGCTARSAPLREARSRAPWACGWHCAEMSAFAALRMVRVER